MALMASKVVISSMLVDRSSPSMAFLDNFISISSIGIITGKLRMAIKEVVFEALEAIPEIMVSDVEKPKAPNNIVTKNSRSSCTGLPITTP